MSSEQLNAFQLTLKDKVNFPYILANQMLTFQKALLALEYSEREIKECVHGFVSIIPSEWKDDKFKEDLDKSFVEKKIDVRPRVAGNIRMSKEACKEIDIPAFKTEKTVDYYLRFQACVDLLNRRGLISEKTKTEKVEGVKYGIKQIEQH